MEMLKTVTGRPLTIPASTRLPVNEYELVRQQAQKSGVTMASLLARWVNEKLAESGGEKCKV